MRNIFFYSIAVILLTLASACNTSKVATQEAKEPQVNNFEWKAANVYFLLTDRFHNGDTSNDITLNRTKPTGKLRGFEGGDLRGVIHKLESNYFSELGVNAIWLTPIVEQIHEATNEGSGNTYGYHGYWTRDWTALDPNFGTQEDLKELVDLAHAQGIRIMLDAVINHTGPVTDVDTVWPSDWVRTEPPCDYQDYNSTVNCTLVKNLPDIKTESIKDVELPPFLIEKWKKEGRYEQEITSLNAFFEETGYPRAPKYYIMKWLADYITEFGIDGYRVDTVKHTEPEVWLEFAEICQATFDSYNKNNPDKFMGTEDFFLVGEVYGYGISQKQNYHFPDCQVNYFENGFPALINFDFRSDASKDFEDLFSYYSSTLNDDLKNVTIMNYISSHDDAHPFDKERENTYEAGTKLLLTPGISQIYYGDESARSLIIEETVGDATLRSNMNWDRLENNLENKSLLMHYQKLGKFRANHPAIGAGTHQMISKSPYWFSRQYKNDLVIVGLDLETGNKQVAMKGLFKEGEKLRDAYSGVVTRVKNGKVSLSTDYSIVLLERVY
ncbi:alpha-amylase [Flavobacteriaceae bacterium Ap0902]|nr:alpha-amylase [Flavobacteriaceae bacterium Ap0902]